MADIIPPADSPDPRYRPMERMLEALDAAGLRRRLIEVPRDGEGAWINLCSNDYLGLARDPRVAAGAKAALDRYGAGAGSARLISGELGCYRALEEALADFLGHESALLFPTGYQANLGLLATLPGPGGRTFSDALNHASIIDGTRLGRSKVTVFPHNDLAALRAFLEAPVTAHSASGTAMEAAPAPGATLVVTEGLFSMDGDVAPVAAMNSLARASGALLAVDDAHALGTLGEGGRGTAWKGAPGGGADLLVGTFGKALGSAGAFVAGPRVLRELLISRARAFIFTTGPGPAAVGAAHAALEVVRTDPEPRERLAANVRRVREGLTALGFDLGSSVAHIIPIVVGAADLALRFAEMLMAEGIYVRAIRPPTVPEGTCRIRITVSAGHTAAQLDRAIEAIGQVARRLEVIAP